MLKNKELYKKIGAVILAVFVWQVLSMLLNKTVLLPSPVDVILRLCSIWKEPSFSGSVWFTSSRIIFGFLIAFIVGNILAFLAGKFHILEIILWPYMITIKTVPVVSFIILALIWLNSYSISVLVVFLIVLPVVYTNVLSGIKNIDKKMLEMADVFKIKGIKRLYYIWLPQTKPYILSAESIAVGLAYKSGIAAELIGIPEGSVGESLYYSKVYFNMTDLFAWTVIIIIISILFEKLFALLLRLIFKGVEKI